jgi:hypothetical protein
MRIRWAYLEISTQSNTRLLDVTLGWSRERGSIRIMRDVPVDSRALVFVHKSTFTVRYIVHPGGGNAARLVCESCGAEYPYGTNPTPCAFCAVRKESGIRIRLWGWKKDWMKKG